MRHLDQKICSWGGIFCAVLFGIGLFLAGFIPPPSPSLTAQEIADIYANNTNMIRFGMIICLTGMAGFVAFVCLISAQMAHMKTTSQLPTYLQLGAGAIGVLTVMLPTMVLAIAAFRPERDPALTQLLNDLAWLIIIPAFPTFIAQFGAIAYGCFADQNVKPIYPRWVGYFNIWIAILFTPGALAYVFKTGPFAWDGVLSFWVAAGAFFVWLLVMTPVTRKTIGELS